MNVFPKRIVFDRYAEPVGDGSATFLYSDDPVVQLEAIQFKEEPKRTEPQLKTLPASLPVADPVFGASLAWPYRGYIVRCLSTTGAGQQPIMPLGIVPERAIDRDKRREQTSQAQVVDRPPFHFPPPETGQQLNPQEHPICLFNVIVALEWTPGERYLRRLEWAFKRASDFLYDVTDGYMAFGQVVFGGPELMDCADIQIMASNRLHPRSWTNGLHNAPKYMPIRVGRGIWHKNNRITIPWDEPEAYRTIVHEWGHYALSLKDEYLGPGYFKRDPDPDKLLHPLPEDQKGQAGRTLALPAISLAIDSIMSTLASSELVQQKEQNSLKRKLNEWDKLAEKSQFKFLSIDTNHRPIDGPMRLPLPLPHFHRMASLGGDPPSIREPQQHTSEPVFWPPAERIQYEHCWVYVIAGSRTMPQRLIAQGTLDARSPHDGFQLLGAETGNTIVLIGLTPGTRAADGTPVASRPVVVCGTIMSIAPHPEDGQEVAAVQWDQADATPDSFWLVDVLPVVTRQDSERPEADGGRDLPREIRVRVAGDGNQGLRKWVFPLGAPTGMPATDQPLGVATLDGHVLVSTEDGKRLTISTYSQGGGPGSSPPVSANPTAAGSAEGNVMLFFYDDRPFYGPTSHSYEKYEQDDQVYSSIRVITTMNHGIQPPEGASPRGYTFSMASNEPLPLLSPTLVMYYDKDATRGGGALRIYRQQDGDSWVAAPTWLPEGESFAAAPLDEETAQKLVAKVSSGERIERYRLCLVPSAG